MAPLLFKSINSAEWCFSLTISCYTRQNDAVVFEFPVAFCLTQNSYHVFPFLSTVSINISALQSPLKSTKALLLGTLIFFSFQLLVKQFLLAPPVETYYEKFSVTQDLALEEYVLTLRTLFSSKYIIDIYLFPLMSRTIGYYYGILN